VAAAGAPPPSCGAGGQQMPRMQAPPQTERAQPGDGRRRGVKPRVAARGCRLHGLAGKTLRMLRARRFVHAEAQPRRFAPPQSIDARSTAAHVTRLRFASVSPGAARPGSLRLAAERFSRGWLLSHTCLAFTSPGAARPAAGDGGTAGAMQAAGPREGAAWAPPGARPRPGCASRIGIC